MYNDIIEDIMMYPRVFTVYMVPFQLVALKESDFA